MTKQLELKVWWSGNMLNIVKTPNHLIFSLLSISLIYKYKFYIKEKWSIDNYYLKHLHKHAFYIYWGQMISLKSISLISKHKFYIEELYKLLRLASLISIDKSHKISQKSRVKTKKYRTWSIQPHRILEPLVLMFFSMLILS